MTLQLSDEQRQAVKRGEVICLANQDIGEVVVLQSAVLDESVREDRESSAWAKAARRSLESWGRENPFDP